MRSEVSKGYTLVLRNINHTSLISKKKKEEIQIFFNAIDNLGLDTQH